MLRISLVLAGLGLVALILVGPVFISARSAAANTVPLAHLTDIATANLIYAADNSDHLPQASDWRDAVEPYVQRLEEQHDVKRKSPRFGTAMNEAVCGTSLLAHSESVVLIFSSKDKTRNAIGGADDLMIDPSTHKPWFATVTGMVLKNRSDVLWSDPVKDFQ